MTRATLLARLKDVDDHRSWQEFFDTYCQLIHGVAVRRGLTPSEAQDVVQETMISVAKHMPGFKYDPEIGSFKAWLLQMARWRIFDQFKKRQRLVVEHEKTGGMPPDCVEAKVDAVASESELEALWDQEWENNLLNAAVGKVRRRLSPRQYQAYDLYVNKAWSPERVSKFLAMSVDQVYLAKHRVLDAIKAEVQRLQREII